MLDDAGVTVMDGRGRVVASGAVEVNGESYTAKRILVAVGARPNVPALPGLEPRSPRTTRSSTWRTDLAMCSWSAVATSAWSSR